MIKYGEIIPELEIEGKAANYAVVNERSIRATAGIMFLIGFATFMYTILTKDFYFVYIVVPLFWLDFLLKSVFAPKWSIFGFFGRLIVSKQKAEYVGAVQKRFAWSIGLLLASIMMVFVLWLGARGTLPLIICSICLFFMWLESACGICVGCKMYSAFIKHKLVKEPEVKPACPGGVCSIDKK